MTQEVKPTTLGCDTHCDMESDKQHDIRDKTLVHSVTGCVTRCHFQGNGKHNCMHGEGVEEGLSVGGWV